MITIMDHLIEDQKKNYEKEFFWFVNSFCQKWPSKIKTMRQKKIKCPPLPPIFDDIPNKFKYQCLIFWKNIRVLFWFRQVISFWRFFWRSKSRQTEITCLNQKWTLIFFHNMGHWYPYLLGISSKFGGNGGHLLFFQFLTFDDHFWQEEIDESKKFFFLILLLIFDWMVHNNNHS